MTIEHLTSDIIGSYVKENELNRDLLEDFIQIIFKSYRKILRFNITDDTFESIKLEEKPTKTKLSEWLEMFIATGNIHYQDIKDLLDFMDPKNLSTYFTDSNSKKKVIRYRRLSSDSTYKWVALYIFPSREFTKDNQVIYLCIRDIQNDYDYRVEEQRKTQYLSTHDPITGFKNRLALVDDMPNLHSNSVIRIKSFKGDLNSLKRIITNVMGSIKYEIYVYNDDELIILFESKDRNSFAVTYKELTKNSGPDYIFGYAFSSDGNLSKLMKYAEDIMYEEA